MQHGSTPAMMRRRRFLVLAAICLATISLAAASGCTANRDAVPAAVASLPPTSHAGGELRTISTHEVGEFLVVTAAVAAVMTGRAFVISDVDLPDQGLLVLGDAPADIRQRSLVTVGGVVDRFDFHRFAAPYRLEQCDRYRAFDGRKILVAHSVRSWA